MKSEYEVTVRVTAKVKVKTMARSINDAYNNVRDDFHNDPQDFLESYDYEVEESSYDEVDAEPLDEPW